MVNEVSYKSITFSIPPGGSFHANVSWTDGRSYTGPMAAGAFEGEDAYLIIPPRDVYTYVTEILCLGDRHKYYPSKYSAIQINCGGGCERRVF